MSDIFAAQITAVANVLLALFAIVTAVLAFLAWRTQSREVGDQSQMLELQRRQLAEQEKTNLKQAEVLELQARELRESLEERKREAERGHRAQAVLVFISQSRFKGRRRGPLDSEPPALTATVVNSSSQPLYDAEIWWHPRSEGSDKPNPEPIGTVLPGASGRFMRKFPFEAADYCEADLQFTDAAGNRWIRRTDGFLHEMPQTATRERPQVMTDPRIT
jgi:hypothetical protein